MKYLIYPYVNTDKHRFFKSGSEIIWYIASIAEELADDETDQEAVEIYVERLHDLNEDPVRINSADEAELSRLFFLTDFQIKSIADTFIPLQDIFIVWNCKYPGFNRELAEQ